MKCTLFFLIVLLVAGCLPPSESKQAICFDSSKELYDYFVKEVNSGTMAKAGEQFDYDSQRLLIELGYFLPNPPKLFFVPKKQNGALGLHKKENFDLYYTNFVKNGEPDSIRVIVIGKKDSCFKILSIAPVSDERASFQEKKGTTVSTN